MGYSYYSDYVTHCMRYYARYPNPDFDNNVSRQNWIACDNGLRIFSDENKRLLMEIYKERYPFSDVVHRVATLNRTSHDEIWKLIRKLEYEVAKQRGLI